MGKKLVALFVVCIVVAAAMQLSADAAATEEQFRSCFNNCKKECQADGGGGTYCEMKCDTDCLAKEAAGKL
ncbi:conserved hypothetical protein [Ricinus communis]|uniref:Major pollen allergen Ole e 6-like n=1 Tax=Ricinus communis TaxID=3988 RepID=B9SFI5_RICCO|nr:conserved hypothetical protein [Ricinus communis]